MSASAAAWRVHLSAAAETDIAQILSYTLRQFGDAQVRVYAETVSMALQALAEGPTAPGARPRDDILKALYSIHVARQGRPGRHFVMFRVARDGRLPTIEVVRLLYDGMDLRRHVDAT